MDCPSDGRKAGPTAGRWVLPGLLWAAAALAAVVGTWGFSGLSCPSCAGILSVVLPWVGFTFYMGLGVLAWRRPESSLLTHAAGLSAFSHACLLTESLLNRTICPGCLGIAGLAMLAAGVVVLRVRTARLTLALSFGLGAAAGFVHPFGRVEDSLTRRLWPSRIVDRAPAFVDRSELAACGHSARVKFIAYEDERTCRTCSGVGRRLIPELVREFPWEVCIHRHSLSPPPQGQVLPVLVLYSSDVRLVVIEGLPSTEELFDLVRDLVRDPRAVPAVPR